MQRLERHDIECEPIPHESLARAARLADLVARRGDCGECSTPHRSGRLTRRCGGRPVGREPRSGWRPRSGCRLPVEYVDAIGAQVIDVDASWDLDVDDLPLDLVTHVASAYGVSADVAAELRPDCPFAPELLRFSPF